MFRYSPTRTLLLLCGTLIAARIIITGETTFAFLGWNVFLATVSLVLSRLLRAWAGAHLTPVVSLFPLCLAFLWLLFLPNGPYIVTDLVHLQGSGGPRLYYDFVLISTCAFTGLLCTFRSLRQVEELLHRLLSPTVVRAISLSILLLCSYGIYLGRFVRFNSWDALLFPGSVLGTIRAHALTPSNHPQTWEFTVGMGLFLWLAYGLYLLRPDRVLWKVLRGRSVDEALRKPETVRH